jgi:Putative threonine efflux protein
MIINFGSFVAAAIILSLIPGSDTIFVLGNSLSAGRKAGIMSALGTSSGCLVHTALAGLGLSVILGQSIIIFNLIKYLGACYLVYLGICSMLSKSSYSINHVSKETNPLKKIFIRGLITDVSNPKVALFFLAFLPQFINPDNLYGPLPFFVLGFIFTIMGLTWLMTLVTFSSFIAKNVINKIGPSGVLNKLTGMIFVCLGLNLFRMKME